MLTPMNHRMLFLCVLALLAAPVLAGCATNNNPSTSSTTSSSSTTSTSTSTTITTPNVGGTLELKLGVFMPITGALSTLGPDMRDGALMAVDDINTANLGIHITTDVKDDGTTDTQGDPSKFQAFVSEGDTAIV